MIQNIDKSIREIMHKLEKKILYNFNIANRMNAYVDVRAIGETSTDVEIVLKYGVHGKKNHKEYYIINKITEKITKTSRVL